MNGIARFSVAAGLNAERALLQRVCDGLFDCQLLLWRPTGQALVMPGSFERRPGFALASQRCAAQGWPILLRDTGGEPGLRAGVGAVPGAFCDGRYNLTLERRKLAGTAQRWRRSRDGRPAVLAHGAVLMDDWREPMADIVNRFYHACASDLRCAADSHLALGERLPGAWSEAESLSDRYQRWPGKAWNSAPAPCPARPQARSPVHPPPCFEQRHGHQPVRPCIGGNPMSYSTPDPPGQRGYPTLRPAQSRRSGDRLPRSLTQQGTTAPTLATSAMKPARSYRSLNKDFEKP